jgi:putative thioredoxin
MVDVANVIDVTDETFEQVVVEGSKQVPVVVDLWAAWCGPCRTLGPMLEQAAERRAGAFTLAKIDVDAHGVGNALLQAVRSQSIPTVVAFRDGQPVSMFVGAIPEQEIDRFLDSILPTEADVEAKEAAEELAAGDVGEAEQRFREALEKEPDNRDAALGLARILIDRGEIEEARPLIMPHLPDAEAEHLHALIEVAEWASLPPDGRLGEARRAAMRGDWTQALDGMIDALTEDRDGARQALVTAFAALGDDDPLVPDYRRKLAAALF